MDCAQRAAALGPGECDSSPISPERSLVPPPTTIYDPERPPRYVSLAECLAMALEHGNIGSQNLQLFLSQFSISQVSQFVDNLATFGGQTVLGDDNIRVLAFDPAVTATNIESALSKFDTRWTTNLNWNKTDTPIGTALQAAQAGQINVLKTDAASFNTGLLKPLPTGGVAGITFNTNYQLTNTQTARVNPSYQPSLQFQFEQPLLQGFGVEINQLRTNHPNSILTPFNQALAGNRFVEGILITRLRFDEERAEFERNINFMLANVEIAYWTLYNAYWTLYSREQALRQAYEAWKINKARFEAGRVAIQDFAQSRQQYELFRGQRIQALGDILEKERQLRGLLGLPVEDCCRLVPCDAPTLAPYCPDWCTALNEALALRPELVLSRYDVKFRQLDLIHVKNFLLPDLRFTSTYDINGLGSHLDGVNTPADQNHNALRDFASDHFHNWAFGLRLEVPLGFRDANAAVRAARLNLARAHAALCDQERKTQLFLGLIYRRVFEFYEQIQANRALREAAATQLEARFKEFLAGRGTLDFLLEAQRVWADALKSEYDFIVSYQIALMGFEFAKGTLLQYDNVYVSEGPLPGCAQVRAVEHQRERTHALVLAERAVPVVQPACCTEPGHATAGLPQLPANGAAPLPALLEGAPKVPVELPAGADLRNVGPVDSKSALSGPIQPQVPASTSDPRRGEPSRLPEPKSEPLPPPLSER